ncbi:VRR-NUC domain-containing protein [Chromohalobacter sp. TMW 2.2308]|uniref:VRR-NUC domain-containing protein n=1 Tax=Chromohalobacter TaxID=42054 RepID=UPI001FFD6838|nr:MULTISPECIES: VRR-NUC domain-containing protein [Chromohalobacter]MCK2042546.1 VRR-NUC domain-containing protein [Chromohalobacter moromii]MCT8514934.1 VRR-NUC domain-containing protein [Chromohalobacter sp. TMW 2.2271]
MGLNTKPRRPRARNANGTPRKKPVDWEGQEQTRLMLWLKGEVNRGTAVGLAHANTYAVPNGGSRHGLEAAKMKQQGVRSGVSDLVIAVPRGGYHGLYLELKATPPRDAELAESQREWLAKMEEAGYCAKLARGIEEAKAVIREYMVMSPTEVAGGRLPVLSGSEW